jgi:hypothetical protein
MIYLDVHFIFIVIIPCFHSQTAMIQENAVASAVGVPIYCEYRGGPLLVETSVDMYNYLVHGQEVPSLLTV